MLTMNKDKIAKEPAELGHSDFRLLSKLEALIGLSPDVSAAAVAPKDGGGK